MQNKEIFLASQSPRRKVLLESLGLAVIVIPADPRIDAHALELPLPKEDPVAYVQRVALLKRQQGLAQLRATAAQHKPQANALIIAADTTVALDQEIFGKPQNPQHAEQMLARLSGKTHQVHTAVSIARIDESEDKTLVVSSEVTFAPLSERWIADYVQTGEPFDKAGAYAIQGMAQAMIPRIKGSYSGIVGLPLYETSQLIHALSKC